jgi:hypothetical protein
MTCRNPLTHRRQHGELTKEEWVVLFADEGNEGYGNHVWELRTQLPRVPEEIAEFAAEFYGIDLDEAWENVDPEDIINSAAAWDDTSFVSAVWETFEPTGFETQDGAVVLDRSGREPPAYVPW